MKKILNILTLFVIVFSSCTKENGLEINEQLFPLDKKYFPLQTGKTLIYKITEITIDKPSNFYDTSIYYIKEIVDNPFIDNEQDTAYRIERFVSNTENFKWKIKDVWESKITENTAEKVEENQRFIKIRFPLKIETSWNGNIENNLEKQTYTIKTLNAAYKNGNINLDSCLKIVHDSTINQIKKIYEYEMYSKNIGLVYKEKTDLNSQEVIYNVPIEQRIYRGNIYYQELIEIVE